MSSGYMYDVFRLHEVKSKVASKLESVCTVGNLFFLGSADGRITVYAVKRNAGGAFDPANTVHIQTTKYKLPIKQMIPIPDKKLMLVMCGEQVILHQLLEMETDQASQANQYGNTQTEKMKEIGPVRNGKDVIAMHLKKERGAYFLVLVQKKKAMVLEYKDDKGEFIMVRDGLALPEGIKSVNWSGKNLMLGFRKEYVLLNTYDRDAETTSLFPTGKSGTPAVCNLDPFPELVVGEDNTGVRVFLDGQPSAQCGIVWASLPSAMGFFHPYVLSIHDSSSIEVRNPFNLSGRGSQALCQTISIKHVDKLSIRQVVDFDTPKPDARTDPNAFRKDIIVAVNASNSVFLLEMIPIREQALSLAAGKAFEASLDLCKLCPNEIPQLTLQSIKLNFGMHLFSKKEFVDAIKRFQEADADPKFVISLFPNFLPEYVQRQWKNPVKVKSGLETRELVDCLREALTALVTYLVGLRKPPEVELTSLPVTDEGMSQVSIDTALVRCFVFLDKEGDLLKFLSGPNWCVIDDCEGFLKEKGQWVALVQLWKAKRNHDQALHLLFTLGACGTANPTTELRPTLQGQPVVNLIATMLKDGGLPKRGVMLTQAEIERKLSKVVDGDDENYHKLLNQAIGIYTTIAYLQQLDCKKKLEKEYIESYCGWILANVDPIFALKIFLDSQSKHDDNDVVKLLLSLHEPGLVSATLRVSKYLELILGDSCNAYKDRDIHNDRARFLIELIQEERRPEDMRATESQTKLFQFLQKSEYYDQTQVVQWLQAQGYGKSFAKERAVLYHRMKAHAAAIDMYLNETNSMEDAKRYATMVSQDDEDAFKILLQHLLRPQDPKVPVRLKEALEVINTCEGVDAQSALPMLPENTSVAELADFLKNALRGVHSRRRSGEVYVNTLKSRLRQNQVAAVRAKSRYVVVDNDTLCAECSKKIRSDTVFARFPNGVIVHQACLEDEHVCPISHRDFRTGVETLL